MRPITGLSKGSRSQDKVSSNSSTRRTKRFYTAPRAAFIRALRIGLLVAAIGLAWPSILAQNADLIIHSGKILTVDSNDSIVEAMAVRDGIIVALGSNAEVLELRGANTQVINLEGKTVIPGLIDSHTHPSGASMTEFDHPIPDMRSIDDVLSYIRQRASVLNEGDWIQVRQVFITRLDEQRYPTREELDEAAPKNPVVFSTGPDAALNSLALEAFGIDRNYVDDGVGRIERDPETGEPTGVIRKYEHYIDVPENTGTKEPTGEDRYQRLKMLIADYNANGLTTIGDRSASPSALDRYKRLYDNGELTVRVAASHYIDTDGNLNQVLANIKKVGLHPLVRGDHMLRIVGIKTFLDGGMLTGSAYMRQPWGVSKIYSIDDPEYRGVRFIPPDRLESIVATTIQSGLQFTAHSVGDGAVHLLLETYEKLHDRGLPVRETRSSITHSNFMSLEAVQMMKRLGVVVDIQPAWLYLDARTLSAQFGNERLRYFQPLKTIFEHDAIAGGGSDHMQKIGGLRSINPYNPFLGMWIAITRKARGYEGSLHAEESLSREQALRFYTWNNAYLLRQEDRTGSLEEGKFADFVILDRDFLTCPVDEIKDIQPLRTYLSGEPVFVREDDTAGRRRQ
ncbi:MAG TPA: amidohydrolase [Acidobacteriota bacterium]|nr:amidohydrolase [Acidobacteriota bacterium]